MKQTKLLMGMPITIEIVSDQVSPEIFDKVFAYFETIDAVFSPYKTTSDVSKINRKELAISQYSQDMTTIMELCTRTKRESHGYFDCYYQGKYDPSGIVKGWAIRSAAAKIRDQGYGNCYVEAGGDIQTYGTNSQGQPWRIGIRNPFNIQQIVKVVVLSNRGIATSGTYFRGSHIYNPKDNNSSLNEIVSLSVIGPDILEADRFATAAFAMGKSGIEFIERYKGLEGYQIDKDGRAVFTSGWEQYVSEEN